MSYSASTLPRSAPPIRDVLESPMPRRSPFHERPSERILKALAKLDISCSCKASLIVSCAVGGLSGCWDRRQRGQCACKIRELPTCIRTAATPHGCAAWREGKTCSCPREAMACCLVVGCPDRQEGRRCECPRTPTEMCRHVRQKLTKHAKLTPQKANRLADAWAEQLWSLLPEAYADRPLADQGQKTRQGESAVGIMVIREMLGLSLWHPDDERGEDSRKRLRRQAAAFNRFTALMGLGGAA